MDYIEYHKRCLENIFLIDEIKIMNYLLDLTKEEKEFLRKDRSYFGKFNYFLYLVFTKSINSYEFQYSINSLKNDCPEYLDRFYYYEAFFMFRFEITHRYCGIDLYKYMKQLNKIQNKKNYNKLVFYLLGNYFLYKKQIKNALINFKKSFDCGFGLAGLQFVRLTLSHEEKINSNELLYYLICYQSFICNKNVNRIAGNNIKRKEYFCRSRNIQRKLFKNTTIYDFFIYLKKTNKIKRCNPFILTEILEKQNIFNENFLFYRNVIFENNFDIGDYVKKIIRKYYIKILNKYIQNKQITNLISLY